MVTIGFYYFLFSQESDYPNLAALCGGMAFSLGAAADHAMLVFYLLFGFRLLLLPSWRVRWFWFFLPALLTLVPTVACYYIGHSIRPFAARPELFVYPGSVWLPTSHFHEPLTGASWNDWRFALWYGMLMLVGAHGFLIYNTTSCLALYGLARSIRSRAKHWQEAVAVALGSATIVCYYACASANFSSWSYSIR